MALHPPSSILHPRRILVRGVNWLGDAVMTTPALARLREAHPDAHITLLTHEKLKDLWTDHPAVDVVVRFARGESVWRTAGRFRDMALGAALILPNSPRSALEAWLARIPRRIGYARPWRNWFLTDAIPPRAGRIEMRKRSTHEIRKLIAAPAASEIGNRQSAIGNSSHQLHEYLHLAAALGADPTPVAPFLFVSEAEMENVRGKFGLDAATRWLGLVPGAEYGPAKRWPKENFILAARQIQERTGCGLVIFGSAAESPLAAEIDSALRTPHSALQNLSARTSLRELCAALKLCAAVLTNDSGPMHVAAAVGTPVVAIFGSTAPELTGPGLPGDRRHRVLKSEVPCAPCFRRECPIDFRCMNWISVEQVVQAALDVLECRAR